MPLQRSSEVLDLGSQLAARLEESEDLLGSWMSHYVAELIDAAKNAPPDTKPAAQEACARAIFELWRHRASWPDKARLFVELEPVIETLASLSLEEGTPRYYARAQREGGSDSTDDDARRWLEFAGHVDNAARYLIAVSLRSAAHVAAETAKPWAELAKQAGAEQRIELPVINFLLSGDTETIEDQRARVTALQLRLKKLQSFLRIGVALASELREQLRQEDEADAPSTESEADKQSNELDMDGAVYEESADDEDGDGET